ncbi:PIN domain-containing protein [Sorangium cellulosum]|uniref:PIN domain-containing protein n=1 Tax=Sorangium cellulosum TaxID=56 RepID=UPI003D9A937C
MILYVETHWILSCVQAEEWEATELLSQRPESGGLSVYLPAFCIAEAIARFRTIERSANEFRDHQLKKRRHDVRTMQHGEAKRLVAALENAIEEQDRLIGVLSYEFDHFIESIFASEIALIPETHEAVKRAHGYVRSLDMSRGDAIVLGTIIEHAARQSAPRKAFVSGNSKDFGPRTAARTELESQGIRSFSRVSDALGWFVKGG